MSLAPNAHLEPPATASGNDGLLAAYSAHSPALTWIKDHEGRYRYASQGFLARFGMTAGSVLGRTDSEVFPGAGAEVRQHDMQVMATGKPLEAVEEIFDAAGARLHSWFVIKFPLPAAEGRWVGGLAVEITAFKRMEADKSEAENEHRQILDALPDMVLVKGAHSRLHWANKAFREAYGMSNEQLRGIVDAPFVEPDYTQQYVIDDSKVFESGVTLDIPEEPMTMHGGVVRVVHTVKSPVFDSRGKIIKTVGVSRDITERKRLEMELRQAQKLESIGRLASGIAHEINTPIQFVGDQARFAAGAFTDLLEACAGYQAAIARAKANEGRLTADDFATLEKLEETSDLTYAMQELPAAFRSITDGVSRVANLVQAMKRFGHPDKGEWNATDINQALQSTLTIAHHELKSVAEVVTDLGELPLVSCAIGELNQVFLNLLINAAHAIGDVFSKTGVPGTIRVSTRCEDDHVVISIADTGTGIGEDVRNRIFDHFFTTKEVGRGTGQGLAISRMVVVEKHGGTLTFDTEMGRGTTFHVRIPVSR